MQAPGRQWGCRGRLFVWLERAVFESDPQSETTIPGFPPNLTAQWVEISFFEKAIAPGKQYDVPGIYDLAYADIACSRCKAPSNMEVPGGRGVLYTAKNL